MSFHHLDGFFCFTVLVSSENCFMFGINARLDGGFLAVLVGKMEMPLLRRLADSVSRELLQ